MVPADDQLFFPLFFITGSWINTLHFCSTICFSVIKIVYTVILLLGEGSLLCCSSIDL